MDNKDSVNSASDKETKPGDKRKREKCKKPRCMIGGQALMEGVMMRGATSMAMAVRSPSGEILVSTERFKGKKKWYAKVPVIRGVAAFVSSMVSGVKTLMKSAEVSSPEEEKPGKGALTFAVILGVALAVGLFILLPSFLSSLFKGLLNVPIWLESVIEGLLRIIIFVVYLLLVSLVKDIRRTFMYHGAEHRTINCFEKGYEMTVPNIQKCSTRHNRCGTTFLFFVMIFSIIIFSITNWLFSSLNLPSSNVAQTFIKMGIRLALLPLVAGLSYELLRFLALLPDNWLVNIFRAPGLFLQRLTTFPPEDEMAEVALISFMAVYDMDKDESIEAVDFGEYSFKEECRRIDAAIETIGAELCERDWILCSVLKSARSDLRNFKKLNAAQHKEIGDILDRRKSGQPLDYILGHSEFYGLKLTVSPDVLIPRMETEVLVETVLKYIGQREGLKVLDLCCGSGCIALAVGQNSKSVVTGADISESALTVARLNCPLEIELLQSDLFSALEGRKFDIIVTNPPYIATSVLKSLSPEVQVQPILALDGGEDGLKYYKKLSETYRNYLEKGGALFMEIGYDQSKSVSGLFEGAEIIRDLGGNDRVVIVRTEK